MEGMRLRNNKVITHSADPTSRIDIDNRSQRTTSSRSSRHEELRTQLIATRQERHDLLRVMETEIIRSLERSNSSHRSNDSRSSRRSHAPNHATQSRHPSVPDFRSQTNAEIENARAPSVARSMPAMRTLPYSPKAPPQVAACLEDNRRATAPPIHLVGRPYRTAHHDVSQPMFKERLADPFYNGQQFQYMMARQSESKYLPDFSGDPKEWPGFISQYRRSTELCGFSDSENLNRLQSCLKGEAKQAVYALLALPGSEQKVMNILEKRFGRTEFVISELANKILTLPPILDGDILGFIKFASEIQNYVAAIEVLNNLDFLFDPSMLQKLVNKLPYSIKIQWGEYICCFDNTTPRLNEFAAWVERKADAFSVILSKSDNHQEKNLKETTFRTNCRFCETGSHPIHKCPKWERESVNNRWTWAMNQRLCFLCLKSSHPSSRCSSNQNCQNCKGAHHTTQQHHILDVMAHFCV